MWSLLVVLDSWDSFAIVRKKAIEWVCDGFLTAREHVTEYEMGLDFFFFLRKLDAFGFGGGNLKKRERKRWKKTKRERQTWERGKDVGV